MILRQVALLFSALFITLASAQGASVIYRLDSGDKLRVTVYEEKDLSGDFELSGDGVVSLPLLGAIEAKGLSIRELETRIEARLEEGYLKNPRVSIEVMNYRPFYILGEVKEPGSYPYVNNMTVLNAVALGKGYTYRADKDKITIIRASDPNKVPTTVSPDTKVLPGDVVRIEERFF